MQYPASDILEEAQYRHQRRVCQTRPDRYWAVLCSVKGVSTILVFWNGSEKNPAALVPVEDRYPTADPNRRRLTISASTTCSSRKHPWSGTSTKGSGCNCKARIRPSGDKRSEVEFFENGLGTRTLRTHHCIRWMIERKHISKRNDSFCVRIKARR